VCFALLLNLCLQELGISFGEVCPRFRVSPYDKQARIGVESVVELAIAKNTRDRMILGEKLQSWADNWLMRVFKDADNSPFEYISVKNNNMDAVHERIAEFQRLKAERNQEL
jgi:hypothetical protein